MNHPIRRTKPTSLMGLLLFGSVAAHAQTAGVQTPAAPPPATAGVFNDWLRQQNTGFSPFDLGAQFRMRYVDQTYFAVPGAGPTAVDFRANTPVSDNDFLLLRTRVHAGWSPTEWFTVYGGPE
jgi:hypothetical protein